MSHQLNWLRRLKFLSLLVVASTGCDFSVTPLGRDDFPVASERQLYRLNAQERTQFLNTYGNTTIVAAIPGIGASTKISTLRLCAPPDDHWLPNRSNNDVSKAILPIGHDWSPSWWGPRFVVILPDGGGLVFPTRKSEGGYQLLLYQGGRSRYWQLPNTESPVFRLFGSAWISGMDGFYLMAVEEDLTATLWEVRLSRDNSTPVFQETVRKRGDGKDALYWGDVDTGALWWSVCDRAIYAVCLPRNTAVHGRESQYGTRLQDGNRYWPPYVVRIDPANPRWSLIAPGDEILGISQHGLVYSRPLYSETDDTTISEVRLRTLPEGQETSLFRVRGGVGRSALSPDEKYLLFRNNGFLHSRLDSFYGPSILLVWEFDSRKGFVVDTPFGAVKPLAWVSDDCLPVAGRGKDQL